MKGWSKAPLGFISWKKLLTIWVPLFLPLKLLKRLLLDRIASLYMLLKTRVLHLATTMKILK